MRINQNVMAFNASRNLASTNVHLGKSLEKLSSGFRINRAADDAAGLVISQGLRAQIGGLQQATRNAQDGISVVQTAEGALNEIHTMLNRMRELAVQAANTGANDADARGAAQTELVQLRTEVNRIAETTKFGGVNLLDGSYGVSPSTASIDFGGDPLVVTDAAGNNGANRAVTVNIVGQSAISFQLGANETAYSATAEQFATQLENAVRGELHSRGESDLGNSFSVAVEDGAVVASLRGANITSVVFGSGATLGGTAVGTVAGEESTGSGGVFQIGANSGESESVTIANLQLNGNGNVAVMTALWDLDLNTGAADAIADIDAAISYVSTQRGELGAMQNRFESMINNLQVTTENLTASESRIRDTDMAAEMVAFTRNQVLQQAGTAMLAQANQVPQTILQLLR